MIQRVDIHHLCILIDLKATIMSMPEHAIQLVSVLVA